MIRFALLSLLVACAHPAPVAPSTPPINFAYAKARADHPHGDSIPIGDRTAIGRDGFVVYVCIEIDAQQHSQCAALADYTPKEKAPEAPPAKTEPAPAPPAKLEAPKKK